MGSLLKASILSGSTRSLISTPLHKLFENIATTTAATNTALIFEVEEGVRTYTYRHLNSIANCLSKTILQTVCENHLPANGDGDFIVAVSMQPSDYLVMILLAILKTGAAYLPLDPNLPQVRMQHILEEAKPVLVISDEDGKHFGTTFGMTVQELLSSAKDLLSNSTMHEDSLPKDKQLKHQEDGLTIVMYTSGSTGIPKGVRLSNSAILNRLLWQFQEFPYGENETVGVFKTALTFVDSVSEIWGPLLNGLGILVVPKTVTQNPEELVNLLERYEIERLVLVPSLLRSILMYINLQKNQNMLKNLKTWVCSGETLPISLAEEFYKYFLDEQYQLCNFYGSTEVMGDVTYHRLSRFDLNHYSKIPIGAAITNTIVYILNKDFLPVEIGKIGEIFVAGSNLAAGYVNDRDPEKFCTNPFSKDPRFAKLFRTGDYARTEDGILWYEGRKDSQVKIRGHRVDLNEIEKMVNEIPGVMKGVVLCYKSEEVDQKILAFIITDGSINSEEIRKALKTNLMPYMVPQIVIVKDIPLLINGKIDRQALLNDYEISHSRAHSDIDYTGVSEDKIKAAKVLFETVAGFLDKIDGITISIKSHFYESGGTSLNSIFTIAKLREAGYHISVNDFITACNLGEVLSRLSTEEVDFAKTSPSCKRYSIKSLKDEFKDAVTDMIFTSFYNKSPIDFWFRSELSYSDYKEVVDKLWEPLKEQNFSFVVERSDGKLVGVALNHDARNAPHFEVDSIYAVINEIIEYLGDKGCDEIAPEEGVALYSAWVTVASWLSPTENVEVVNFIENETLELARRHNFKSVLSVNENLLTQQLATEVYGYKTCIDYQVNQYVAKNGTRPFGLAPDSQRILVQWKDLNDN